MARMLSDRSASSRRAVNPRKDTWIRPEGISAVRRAARPSSPRSHVEPCKQVKGAEQLAAAIEPVYRDLVQKQAATRVKLDAKQEALDIAVLRDAELDDGVRTAFEKARQFNRDNPGSQQVLKIFPEGRFSEITRTERTKEPDVVEQLAIRIESLGEKHPLYGVAGDLRAKAGVARAANSAHFEAIRNQKLAEADDAKNASQARKLRKPICGANMKSTISRPGRRSVATLPNGFDVSSAERLFPHLSASEGPVEPVPTPAP